MVDVTGARAMLDPVIHQPTRLHILAALFRNRELRFRELRDELGLTAGNLGAHLAKLEAADYVRARRVITSAGVEMAYRLTEPGHQAMRAYLAHLHELLGAATPSSSPPAGRAGARVGNEEAGPA